MIHPSDGIHVHVFDLDLPAARVGGFEHLLSPDEVSRAERFKRDRDRSRFIVGRGQLRSVLAHYLNNDPSSLRFDYGPHGKPSLPAGSPVEQLQFSFSHSHSTAIVGVQRDEELGIDIEFIRPYPDVLQIAQRFFSTEEYETLRLLAPEELDLAFLRYWTPKEAIIKSIGRGLSEDLSNFTVPPGSGHSPEVVTLDTPDHSTTRWLLPVPEPLEGYVTALATAGSPKPVRCLHDFLS